MVILVPKDSKPPIVEQVVDQPLQRWLRGEHDPQRCRNIVKVPVFVQLTHSMADLRQLILFVNALHLEERNPVAEHAECVDETVFSRRVAKTMQIILEALHSFFVNLIPAFTQRPGGDRHDVGVVVVLLLLPGRTVVPKTQGSKHESFRPIGWSVARRVRSIATWLVCSVFFQTDGTVGEMGTRPARNPVRITNATFVNQLLESKSPAASILPADVSEGNNDLIFETFILEEAMGVFDEVCPVSALEELDEKLLRIHT